MYGLGICVKKSRGKRNLSSCEECVKSSFSDISQQKCSCGKLQKLRLSLIWNSDIGGKCSGFEAIDNVIDSNHSCIYQMHASEADFRNVGQLKLLCISQSRGLAAAYRYVAVVQGAHQAKTQI